VKDALLLVCGALLTLLVPSFFYPLADERQEGCAAVPEISYFKDDGSIQAARFAIPPKSSSYA
jgi:hypothetical protein